MSELLVIGGMSASVLLSVICCTLLVPCLVYFLMVSSGSSKQTALIAAIAVYCVCWVINVIVNQLKLFEEKK